MLAPPTQWGRRGSLACQPLLLQSRGGGRGSLTVNFRCSGLTCAKGVIYSSAPAWLKEESGIWLLHRQREHYHKWFGIGLLRYAYLSGAY